METEMQMAEKEQKTRKLLMVLPLLMIPFITLGFWAMGGGRGTAGNSIETSGLNPELPVASRKQASQTDKITAYEQARKDSLKRIQAEKNDPYYMVFDPQQEGDPGLYPFQPYDGNENGFSHMEYADANERKVYEKLDLLNAALNQAQHAEPSRAFPDPEVQGLREDISRLEEMMQYMQNGPDAPDPEMQQISSVLESVLDIQHPERVQERLKKESEENLGQVFTVSASMPDIEITGLEAGSPTPADSLELPPNQNAFFGLDVPLLSSDEQNTIEAVVHETQTVVNGATVKLRLLDDVYINGTYIPKDNFVFGKASLRGDRLEIAIENVRHGNSLFPVQLAVHDLDGIPGIHIPGAITRDVAKQSGEQTLQSLNLGMYNPSLEMQAASAGIELGRNLLTRKIKLIKVEVKAGYRVLLKDGKKKDY